MTSVTVDSFFALSDSHICSQKNQWKLMLCWRIDASCIFYSRSWGLKNYTLWYLVAPSMWLCTNDVCFTPTFIFWFFSISWIMSFQGLWILWTRYLFCILILLLAHHYSGFIHRKWSQQMAIKQSFSEVPDCIKAD